MVADVGCGPGNIGLELEKINWKGVLVGIDIAEKRLQEASSKPIYTSCVQANAYYLPFLDNYFDMVVSSGMVGLTGNCSIDEMRRIVKPGGYIACAVAEIKSLEWCKRRFRKATDYFNKLPNSEILACKDLGTGYASEYKDEHFVVYILKCY